MCSYVRSTRKILLVAVHFFQRLCVCGVHKFNIAILNLCMHLTIACASKAEPKSIAQYTQHTRREHVFIEMLLEFYTIEFHIDWAHAHFCAVCSMQNYLIEHSTTVVLQACVHITNCCIAYIRIIVLVCVCGLCFGEMKIVAVRCGVWCTMCNSA